LARRRTEYEVLPLREELESLVHTYHHLHNEHKQAAPESSRRRRTEERMLEARERFERVLSEWVPDEELQEAWRAHLENRGAAPAEPVAIQPVVFRGVSDEAGSTVEIRERSAEELEVWVDGALTERIEGEKDFDVTARPARFRLDDLEFQETFAASSEALAALADYLDGSAPPPWEYARELLADGLIDVHFALTPRGRRALHAPREG
jgi:hypothetical protein